MRRTLVVHAGGLPQFRWYRIWRHRWERVAGGGGVRIGIKRKQSQPGAKAGIIKVAQALAQGQGLCMGARVRAGYFYDGVCPCGS